MIKDFQNGKTEELFDSNPFESWISAFSAYPMIEIHLVPAFFVV